MLKILVWLISDDMQYLDRALKTLERQHNGIELVGVIAETETPLVWERKNVTFIPLDKVDEVKDYEVLLVVGAKKIGMSRVVKNAAQFNLPEEKLLGDWIVCIPGFTLNKYRQLQHSRLSILSSNCFGGILAHWLGLSVNSPLFNLFILPKDFVKFLREPRAYLKEKLVFSGEKFVEKGNYTYPIAKLGDISVNMMHYKTFEEAVEAWERRTPRINWNNLFVEVHSNTKELLEEFDALPYAKKVCFVPFKSDLDSAWYINPAIDKTTDRLDFKLHRFARGNFVYYDPFDMLLYGKKTQLINM